MIKEKTLGLKYIGGALLISFAIVFFWNFIPIIREPIHAVLNNLVGWILIRSLIIGVITCGFLVSIISMLLQRTTLKSITENIYPVSRITIFTIIPYSLVGRWLFDWLEASGILYVKLFLGLSWGLTYLISTIIFSYLLAIIFKK